MSSFLPSSFPPITSLFSQWFFSAIVNVCVWHYCLSPKDPIVLGKSPHYFLTVLRGLKEFFRYNFHYLSFYMSVRLFSFVTSPNRISALTKFGSKGIQEVWRGPTTTPLHLISDIPHNLTRWMHLLPLQTVWEGSKSSCLEAGTQRVNPVVRFLESETICRKTQRTFWYWGRDHWKSGCLLSVESSRELSCGFLLLSCSVNLISTPPYLPGERFKVAMVLCGHLPDVCVFYQYTLTKICPTHLTGFSLGPNVIMYVKSLC